jgi:Zn-finger nucleic acid-binding protein
MVSVACPRCRAEGEHVAVIMHDGYGVCPRCETTWQRGKLHEMIAIDDRQEHQ